MSLGEPLAAGMADEMALEAQQPPLRLRVQHKALFDRPGSPRLCSANLTSN